MLLGLQNKYPLGNRAKQGDKFTYSLAGLELVRSGTMANGAKCCDFRFRLT